ncbi:Antitoxin [Candidatus Electronema aureum]
MNKTQLDKEEQEILDAFESGEFKSDLTSARKKFIEKSAAQTFKKDKKINVTISGRDLTAIQKRALEEGLSYQTLVASIIHKYVSGSLYDAAALRAAKSEI